MSKTLRDQLNPRASASDADDNDSSIDNQLDEQEGIALQIITQEEAQVNHDPLAIAYLEGDKTLVRRAAASLRAIWAHAGQHHRPALNLKSLFTEAINLIAAIPAKILPHRTEKPADADASRLQKSWEKGMPVPGWEKWLDTPAAQTAAPDQLADLPQLEQQPA